MGQKALKNPQTFPTLAYSQEIGKVVDGFGSSLGHA